MAHNKSVTTAAAAVHVLMKNAREAIDLTRQYRSVGLHRPALSCCNLAVHFLDEAQKTSNGDSGKFSDLLNDLLVVCIQCREELKKIINTERCMLQQCLLRRLNTNNY
nr:hp [Calliteara abietis nucleopolyhedrovirus]